MGREEVWQAVKAADGRSLEVVSQGSADALPLVFHGGTPLAAVLHPPIVDAAIARGLRFITYSRPGYATSDPMPGRSVGPAAARMRWPARPCSLTGAPAWRPSRA